MTSSVVIGSISMGISIGTLFLIVIDHHLIDNDESVIIERSR